MSKTRNQVALVACSNGLHVSSKKQVEQVKSLFETSDLEVLLSPYLYRGETAWSGTAKERADYVMQSYQNPDIVAIYDLSGGDLTNEILPFLDFDVIKRYRKVLVGYSDLTTLLNAVYHKTHQPVLWYQVRHLIGLDSLQQELYLKQLVAKEQDTPVRVTMLQGDTLSGIVVGGNIRCLLKLAGTPYFPDCRQKVILLESQSGQVDRIATYLAQLQQMGVFDQVSGLLLGTFTEVIANAQEAELLALVKQLVPKTLAVGQTSDVGHGSDTRPIWIGRELVIEKGDDNGD